MPLGIQLKLCSVRQEADVMSCDTYYRFWLSLAKEKHTDRAWGMQLLIHIK